MRLKERDCMKMDKERVSLTSGVFYCETKKERKKGFQEKQTNKNIFLNNSELNQRQYQLYVVKVAWIMN